MGSWPDFPPLEKPEGITDQEWAWYQTSEPDRKPELRDKIEAALGWKPDDVADARKIAEQVLGAVSITDALSEVRALNKGHVPEENLFRYRTKMRLARQLKSLGDTIGANDPSDSTVLWRMANKYRDQAQELRVDIPREEDNEHHD